MHIREQSGLGPVLAPSGTPPKLCIYATKVDLGPFWALDASLWDPSELCIYASEMNLGLYKGPLDKL